MTRLYSDVIEKQCELERKVIINALNIATISPDLLAYQIMGGPGYVSYLAGEVVHIIAYNLKDLASMRRVSVCEQRFFVN